ncbi:MAG TPA: hypothetical protein PK725_12520, partial [Rhodocyclaceae bacterium]|nr:hypothetical protein [Rhodocyclaceae bacterium]
MTRQARAKYEITAEDKSRAALNSATKGLQGVKSAALSLQGALAGLGAAFSIKAVIDNTIRQEAAVKQLETALRSTGEAMGFTRDQLVSMAGELQKVTTFGDEAIIEAQARLVTYTGIVGDQFPRALQAVLDQSARLNIGLEQSAEVIGKALESPLKAAEALSHQGFGAAFTREVRATIRALVEAGREGEAQAVILGILEESYGGAAKAARDTFGGALKALGNAFGDLLEADGGGLTGAKNALEDLTRLLSDPGTIAAANALTTALINGFAGAAKALTHFVGLAQMFGENFARSIHGSADPVERLDEEIAGLHDRVRALNDELARPRVLRINPFASTETLRTELEAAEAQITALRRQRVALADLMMSGSAPASTPSGTGSGTGGGAIGFAVPPIDVTRALLDRHTALLRDAITRQLQDLDRAYQDGLTSTAAYFSERARLQAASIDAELDRLRGMLAQARREESSAASASAATDAEARASAVALTRAREQQIALTGQITILERDRAAIAGQAARDQATAERDLARQLDQVRIRLLELTGQTAQARGMAIEREYRELLTRLQAEGDAQGEALVRRLFDVEAARAQLDQIQQEVALAMERMATQEQSIGVQRQTGLLSETQARRELVELHQRTAEEVQRLIPLMLELAAATGDPMAIERVRQLEVRLQELAVTADDVALRINAAFESGLSNALHDFAMGTKTAGEAFRAFARTVITEINKIASQRLAESILGMFGGSGGGIGGFFSGLLKHSGGVVGAGGQFRRIPAFAFAGAPRYHTGGIAGLRP